MGRVMQAGALLAHGRLRDDEISAQDLRLHRAARSDADEMGNAGHMEFFYGDCGAGTAASVEQTNTGCFRRSSAYPRQILNSR